MLILNWDYGQLVTLPNSVCDVLNNVEDPACRLSIAATPHVLAEGMQKPLVLRAKFNLQTIP